MRAFKSQLNKVKGGLNSMGSKMRSATGKVSRALTKDDISIDPDPTHLIEDWVHPLAVPKWDEKNSYTECHFCHTNFTPGHKHNCRLCGHLYCSDCTSKLHVPKEFKLKNKSGAVRVCYPCRGRCLDNLKAGDAMSWATFHDSTFRVTSYDTKKDDRLVLHPPSNWVKEDDPKASKCFKCQVPFNKNQHNCRMCGVMACDNCSSKMNVPTAFERKKKSGPARVCDECRYLIIGGAQLSSLPPSIEAKHSISLSSKQQKKYVPPTMSVRWDDKDKTFIAELTDKTRTKSLTELYKEFLKVDKDSHYDWENDPFYFLCRGKPVFQEHWQFYNFSHFSPELLVRKGFPEDDVVIRPPKKEKPLLEQGEVAVSKHDYHKLNDETHLQLKAGDVVVVTRKPNNNWWYGKTQRGTAGWFPASYVHIQAEMKDDYAATEHEKKMEEQGAARRAKLDKALAEKEDKKSAYQKEMEELEAELARAALKEEDA